MKAVLAHYSLGKEAWDRVRSAILRRGARSPSVSLQQADIPEPALPGPQWARVRTISCGLSDMDEGMFVHGELSPLGAYLSFPFVPGNENLGIVSEAGPDVQDVETGERVVVNPLLACRSREIQPLCASCARGDPSSCENFDGGRLGPGILIGGCRDTSGGWADSFVAHRSQLAPLPSRMSSDESMLVPEFTRAVRAVLQYPPASGERVIIVGARSLGLLVLLALQMLGHRANILMVAEHAFEAELARKLGRVEVVLSHGPASAYSDVAQFVKGTVRYPEVGHMTLQGGADLVYETTGTRENLEDALCFTREGKRLVLTSINQSSVFDLAPFWFKGVEIHRTLFSGTENVGGTLRETMDIALDLVATNGLPVAELVTHRLGLQEYTSALAALKDRSASKAVKVVFLHVM